MMSRKRPKFGQLVMAVEEILFLFLFLLSEMDMRGETRRTNVKKGCNFPADWNGIWFQSTIRPYINIDGKRMGSKGTCIQNVGDKYILQESRDCYKCLVFHQRAHNVLQYKETFGCAPYNPEENQVRSLCSEIAGDANLYSMFRVDGSNIDCPFFMPSMSNSAKDASFVFSYDRGKGFCQWPQSRVERCTSRDKIMFQYQACPNVPGSEMMAEQLECHSTWRDGSYHYLVGKMSHTHAVNDEDKFRCFVYQYKDPLRPQLGMNLAQSGDATCNGLFSPVEGPRTMVLSKGPSKVNCTFWEWLSGRNEGIKWNSLDQSLSIQFKVEHSTSSFMMLTRMLTKKHGITEYFTSENSEGICHQMISDTQFIFHQTVGCQNGYVCAEFHRKSEAVVTVKLGAMSRTSSYACDKGHFGADIESKLLVREKVSSTYSRKGEEQGTLSPPAKQEQILLLRKGLYKVANGSQFMTSARQRIGKSSLSVAEPEEVRTVNEGFQSVGDVCGDKNKASKSLDFILGCEGRSDLRVRSTCDLSLSSIPKEYRLIYEWQRDNEGSEKNLTESHSKVEYKIFQSQDNNEAQKDFLCLKFQLLRGEGLDHESDSKNKDIDVEMTRLDINCNPLPSEKSSAKSDRATLSYAGDCSGVSTAAPRISISIQKFSFVPFLFEIPYLLKIFF